MPNVLELKPATPIIVETFNTITILGNSYKKYNLSCISKMGCDFNVFAGNNHMNLSKYMNIGTSYRYGERNKKFGIVNDPYIKDRFYFVINNHHSNVNNTYSYLMFADEDADDNIDILGNVNVNNIDWCEIVDIDENYIYATGTYLVNGGVFIYRINKDTKTVDGTIFSVTKTSRAKCNLICKKDMYLYFIVGGINGDVNTYARFNFIEYNKETKVVSSKIFTHPALGSYAYNNAAFWMQYNNVDVEDFYEENGKYYWCYPQYSGYTSGSYYYDNLRIICFDSSKTFSDSNVITTSSSGIKNSNIIRKDDIYHVYRFWIVDDYLYYALYDEKNSDADMKNYQGIHVFKINPGFKLEYISKIQITTNKNIISMIYDSTKSTLLIGYYNSFEIYLYNKETHLYDKMNREFNDIMCTGFDSQDRLWYQNINYGVSVIRLDDPVKVEIQFEHIYYVYENKDIDSYITFKAIGYLNEPSPGQYFLTLSDNAYFKDTLTDTITINYTKNIEKIPIVITGPKKVTCSAKFKKMW